MSRRLITSSMPVRTGNLITGRHETMENVCISRQRLSSILWEIILENAQNVSHSERHSLLKECAELNRLRSAADYNTGTISDSSCWIFFSLAFFFKPQLVAEVGTFIGRSTLSICRGIERADVADAAICTCDFSNDISLPVTTSVVITQFRKKTSTDMFRAIASRNIRCDFLVLDGRLQQDDYNFLGEILHSESIIVLDDFEGIEKGVANASSLMPSLQESHHLIYPPTREALRAFGFVDGCSTALIIPKKLCKFTNQ
jgi:hypothetical protein